MVFLMPFVLGQTTCMADRRAVITVEVAYATATRQSVVSLGVQEGTSVREAVLLSGLTELYPEIDPAAAPLGIFGRVVADPGTRLVHQGDRVEIYRHLQVNSHQVRHERLAARAQQPPPRPAKKSAPHPRH